MEMLSISHICNIDIYISLYLDRELATLLSKDSTYLSHATDHVNEKSYA
jgi:hypothetical protein